MPPKRRRGGARKSGSNDTPATEAEDAKPSVDTTNPLSTEAEDNDNERTILATAARASAFLETGQGEPPTELITEPATESTNTPVRPPSQRGKKLTSQPRANRRSQVQRQEIQRAEDERKQAETSAKAADDAVKLTAERIRYRDVRGSGRVRNRGRGGYMGVSERAVNVPSGPFSAGQVSKESRGARRSGGGSRGQTGSTRVVESQPRRKATEVNEEVKQEAEASTNGRTLADTDRDVKMEEQLQQTFEDGGFISSDDESDEKGAGKINVEELGVIDLTLDDAFAPVRVARVAHKDKALGINADGATNQDGLITIDANDTTTIATSEKRKGKQKAREAEATSEQKRFQATYSDSESDAEIKQDPEGDADQSAHHYTSLREPRSSSEARRKPKEKAKANEALSDGLEYHYEDELDELDRQQKDLAILRHELGGQKEVDQDGDATMTDSQSRDRRTEKVYLFQFPPILPSLTPISIKPDPAAAADGEDMHIDNEPITIPDNENNIDDFDESKINKPSPPTGAVGKLKVHASGRVTLDWGGTSLALGMGTEVSFLQDILVANLPDALKSEDDDVGVVGGTATSMGQVKGKFVVTPDLEEMLR